MIISRQRRIRACLARRSTLLLLIAMVAILCFFQNNVILGGSDLTILTQDQESAVRNKDGISTLKNKNQTSDTLSTYSIQAAATTITTTSSASTTNQVPKQVIWSYARSDRSGAAIQDMLMCHAYAFHHNMIYGGACARDWNLPQFQGKRQYHEELLRAIGLDNVLQFKCPKDPNTKLMNRQHYIQNDTAIFTPSYLNYLQSLLKYDDLNDATKKHRQPQIAVHIRRGDISPCRPRTRGYPRYLPNQHFLRLIDRYQTHNNNNNSNDSRVLIYSESQSFEPFDEFTKRGYEVILDGSIGDVWKGILSSDVVILSRSSFSLVPAIMSKGTIVFTPFWHEPLPHWHVVEESFVNETLMEFRRLKATCPPKVKR